MKDLRKLFGAVVIFACLIAASAQAGGLYLYELGNPEVGLAGAGWTARAQDAATVFTNPAGMTRLQESELLIGTQPLYLDVEFSPDSSKLYASGMPIVVDEDGNQELDRVEIVQFDLDSPDISGSEYLVHRFDRTLPGWVSGSLQLAIDAGLWVEGGYGPSSQNATRLFKVPETGLWLFEEP